MEIKLMNIREFKLPRSPYNKGEILYKKSKIELKPGVTVLVGCNGCGKSTFIREVSTRLDKDNIPYLTYDNLHDGGSNSFSKAMFHNNLELASTLFVSSEGEQIITNIGTYASEIGRFVRSNKDEKEIWIFLDAIDSGLSIDNILDMKEYLFKTIIDNNSDKNIYIIVSANEYEMCNSENCFDVYNGKYIKFNNYDEYKQFIIKSKEIKDKRYKKEAQILAGIEGDKKRIEKYRDALIEFNEYLDAGLVEIQRVELKDEKGEVYYSGDYAINLCVDESKMKELKSYVSYLKKWKETDEHGEEKEKKKLTAQDMCVVLIKSETEKGFEYESLLFVNEMIRLGMTVETENP